MNAIWIIALVILVMAPLVIPGSRRDFWRKSTIETVADAFPRKYRPWVTMLHFVLILFLAAKVKGVL